MTSCTIQDHPGDRNDEAADPDAWLLDLLESLVAVAPYSGRELDAVFREGTLWDQVVQTTQEAQQTEALVPIPTDYEIVEDGGIPFLVRIVANLDRKERLRRLAAASASPANPFLPYEEALHVTNVTESHVGLLNKFNVVEHHLLIVTRRFVAQESPLDRDDFQALWMCMREYESLGFYNAGTISGASQPHKHLQVVPLPLAPAGPAVPIERAMEECDLLGTSSQLPFPHVVARLDPDAVHRPAEMARTTLARYHDMMDVAGVRVERRRTDPYNLLVTRRWLLLVPRYRETFESISLNALAFAGALLVRNSHQLEVLKDRGPMSALKYVATPAHPGDTRFGRPSQMDDLPKDP